MIPVQQQFDIRSCILFPDQQLIQVLETGSCWCCLISKHATSHGDGLPWYLQKAF